MNILQSTQNLVQEKLYVSVAQRLRRFDNGTEIRLHQLTDDVDIVESIWIQRSQDRFETYDLYVTTIRHNRMECVKQTG